MYYSLQQVLEYLGTSQVSLQTRVSDSSSECWTTSLIWGSDTSMQLCLSLNINKNRATRFLILFTYLCVFSQRNQCHIICSPSAFKISPLAWMFSHISWVNCDWNVWQSDVVLKCCLGVMTPFLILANQSQAFSFDSSAGRWLVWLECDRSSHGGRRANTGPSLTIICQIMIFSRSFLGFLVDFLSRKCVWLTRHLAND